MSKNESNELPGEDWGGALSPKPLVQGLAFLKGPHAYTSARAEAAGCPVFKAHPGVRSVLVSDHAGLEAVFSAPPEQLDREKSVGFGCVALWNDEVLEGQVPALLSHRGNHAPARALVDRAMALRGEPGFTAACNQILAGGWPALAQTDSATFEEAMVHAAGSLAFRWFFDLEGPDGAAHLAWLRGAFGIKTDTRITNLIARMVAGPPGSAVRTYGQQQFARIRACALHPAFAQIAAELGLPAEAVAPHLFFAAGFNATGGTYTTAFPALGTLHARPDLRERLAGELDGFSGTVDELDALPFLDAFFVESQRHFGRPKQYYREAVVDVDLPTSDGRKVRIPAGSRVGLVAVSARQDPTVFDDPAAFRPERFLDDSALAAKVHAFGPPADGPSPYGCAGAANNTAPRMWKTIVACLARDRDWKLEPAPSPNIDAKTGLDPDSLTWHRC